MKITDSPVCNPYRAKGKWYHKKKGHTGEDRLFDHEIIVAPCDGEIVRVAKQKQMGLCVYFKDYLGNIHVFAHCQTVYESKRFVRKGQWLFRSGNTGTRTTAPHTHHEIITPKPLNIEDRIMTRKLFEFEGYNTDPVKYLKTLNHIPEPTWIVKTLEAADWIKSRVRVPYPAWLKSKHG